MGIQGVIVDEAIKHDEWPSAQRKIVSKLKAMTAEIEDTIRIVQSEHLSVIQAHKEVNSEHTSGEQECLQTRRSEGVHWS